MKKLLFPLFGLLVLVGCKKTSEDPKAAPTPVQAVTGLYVMTSVGQGPINIPLPTTGNGIIDSGTINVVAVTGKTDLVDMTITIKRAGQPDNMVPVLGVQVLAANPGYQLIYNKQQAGTADGTNLALTYSDPSLGTIVAKAKK